MFDCDIANRLVAEALEAAKGLTREEIEDFKAALALALRFKDMAGLTMLRDEAKERRREP